MNPTKSDLLSHVADALISGFNEFMMLVIVVMIISIEMDHMEMVKVTVVMEDSSL